MYCALAFGRTSFGGGVAGKPEEKARAEIDRLLEAAGWSVQDLKSANIHAAQGVALREFKSCC